MIQRFKRFLTEYSWRDERVIYPGVYRAIIRKKICLGGYDDWVEPGFKNAFIVPQNYSSRVWIIKFKGNDFKDISKWSGRSWDSWESWAAQSDKDPNSTLMSAVDVGEKVTDPTLLAHITMADQRIFG